jgi:hypothetical protein
MVLKSSRGAGLLFHRLCVTKLSLLWKSQYLENEEQVAKGHALEIGEGISVAAARLHSHIHTRVARPRLGTGLPLIYAASR